VRSVDDRTAGDRAKTLATGAVAEVVVAATRLDTHGLRWLSRGMAISESAGFGENSTTITRVSAMPPPARASMTL
jgi:hypothetical protein